MPARGRTGLLIVALALAGAAYVALRAAGPDYVAAPSPVRTSSAPAPANPPSPRANVPPAAHPGVPATPPRAAEIDALAKALAGGDLAAVRSSAQDLRRLVRTDASARRAAEGALLDATLPADVRCAIALVLGTLPGSPSDAALLAALGASPDPALERCLVLALGAYPCDDDDEGVFDMGERPWGGAGPGGLGITVRRVLDDANVRAALAARLARPDAALRRAAADALRHTTSQPDVRSAFAQSLRTEGEDDVALVLGESLAAWARRAVDPGERDGVLALVVDRASDERFDAYRLRIEDDLRGAPLSTADRERLRALADPARPFGFRAFALTVLATAKSSDGADAEGDSRAFLHRTLAGDADPAARDLCAQLLSRLPADAATVAALARAARDDTAWNVRHAAVTSLAHLGARDDVRAAIEAAQFDNDPRVAQEAREALERLRGR
jgi:hypothetical protein